MRVQQEQLDFLKQQVLSRARNARVYLFGSRADDRKRGGDIDILIIGERMLSLQEKRDIKIAFYKKFGEQKIDLASFMKDDPSPFKKIAELDGILL